MESNLKSKNNSGFTLVELAIVIVIIGLLVGGVLQGQELIQTSKRNTIISEWKSYEAAVRTFQAKYNALPGDMVNATTFWPTQTTNGDGDTQIELAGGGYENSNVPEQLILAKVVVGSYDGGATSNADYTVGRNILASKYAATAGHDLNYRDIAGVAHYFTFAASSTNYWNGPAINASNAWLIDLKIDDGVSRSGKVKANASYYSGAWHGGECIDSTTFAYITTTDELKCIMVYSLD